MFLALSEPVAVELISPEKTFAHQFLALRVRNRWKFSAFWEPSGSEAISEYGHEIFVARSILFIFQLLLLFFDCRRPTVCLEDML